MMLNFLMFLIGSGAVIYAMSFIPVPPRTEQEIKDHDAMCDRNI
jgi:hypothetical protein